MTSATISLAALNAADQERFASALGWVFEDSPWVMQQTFTQGPFASVDALHAASVACVQAAPRDQQLALLRAHPDLGTRAKVSDVSQAEQANAGLGSLTPEEFAKLRQLNDAYLSRFGFPFLYAVKGSNKHDILSAMEARVQNSPESEFQEALRQVYRIARFRLEQAIS